jgi:signal transduction histidine kinase
MIGDRMTGLLFIGIAALLLITVGLLVALIRTRRKLRILENKLVETESEKQVVYDEIIALNTELAATNEHLLVKTTVLAANNQMLNDLKAKLELSVTERTQQLEQTISELFEEIEEHRSTEQILQDTLEQLKQRNLELDNYVYKVSHDLRAPLTSVLGLIYLMEIEQDSGASSQYLHLMRTSIQKADTFIQSVLAHSKALKMEIRPTSIDFADLLEECREALQYMPGADRLKVHIQIQEECPFYSDLVQVSEILKNFYSNAIKYQNLTRPDPYVSFTIFGSQDQTEIRIEDNGIGIDPRYQHQIFNMFFRATEKATGSGLGLYIVHQIVEKLGGTLTLESRLNEGTVFIITLPNLLPVEN